jgi:hypothetical protein
VTETRPLTKQRSPWVEQADLVEPVPGFPMRLAIRHVHDGRLIAMYGEEPTGWHMSVSHRSHGTKHLYRRYPTWDELSHARYELLPGDRDFVMHLPPLDEYVSLHPSTFHLHEHPERT